MKRILARATYYVYITLILAVASVTLLPALEQTVSAGQVTTRFIQVSDATPSATGVSYNVSFKPTVTSNIGGIVVDFCADSPIIGTTTCTYPANFSVGGATPTTTGSPTGFSTSTGSWVTTNSLQGGAAGGSRQVFIFTNATPQTPSGTSTPIAFTITNVVNTSATGSFYARILTFDTDAHTTSEYTASGTTRAASFADQIDYGGVALSTSVAISITAKIQETLTFCVSKAAPGSACSGTTTPTLTLGHGSPSVLDSTAVDTDTAYTQVSSNAGSGVVVNLKVTSSAACAGLSRDSGATCGIPAIGSFAAIVAGTANFGLNVADGSGGTGTVTHNANYGTTGGSYGMRTQTFGTYGDSIESSSAATSNVNSLLTYGATASLTTTAGIYTATHSLIATGTF